jgi:hypothetical protein
METVHWNKRMNEGGTFMDELFPAYTEVTTHAVI